MATTTPQRLRQLQPSTIERAYELARSGLYPGVTEIRMQLKNEGYADYMSQLEGAWIKSQLRKLSIRARATVLPRAGLVDEQRSGPNQRGGSLG